ncbi:alpha/beta hydrolase [Rhodococcus erythropolis]|uniref:alpha/beta hydrolase n=1 Tax=Rhodococcus erythropolis TaxID=1833 RepID=UPI001E62DD88|nr:MULTISPECIES: alpha/beta hydrolase [Rhodococcus erythropolis group]MCD2106891.1 alpha/beta hydrolase [Rhodococcus qingshengii]MCZ4525942.1 alpha/beta hydrolase [Rhodococcus erythropolis]
MQSNSQTIEFTSETTSNGAVERHFVLDDITGVLWSPASGSVGSPLLLSGHSGGMHKKAPGLVASALHSVSSHGFTVAAIDAPGHGDRPRNTQDEQWVEAIHQARAAREPIAPIVVEYNRSLAERAVPEWQATLDALQALPEVDADAPIGFGGVSLGVVTGLMLAPADSRIAAVSFGGVFVDSSLLEAARKLTVPVEYRIPWDEKDYDRTSGVALFDAFGSKEKTLHAYSGRHYPVPDYERDSSARFFARHLGGSSGAPVS